VLSWRILGSLDALLLRWLFTSHREAAAAIASSEVLTKMMNYYLHECAWSSVGWELRHQPDDLVAKI